MTVFSWMAGSIPGSSPGTVMTAGAAPQPNRTTGIAIRATAVFQFFAAAIPGLDRGLIGHPRKPIVGWREATTNSGKEAA